MRRIWPHSDLGSLAKRGKRFQTPLIEFMRQHLRPHRQGRLVRAVRHASMIPRGTR